jgi:hypothetical protein
MKDIKQYQHWSTEALNSEKNNLLEEISKHQEALAVTKSTLYKIFLTHCIKSAKEEIHVIETELYYRTHKDN